jgi:putative SOS response-associated peptidase YedK
MCGRFVAPKEPAQLREVFSTQNMPAQPLAENYNVSPTQDVYVVVANQAIERELKILKWGLSASWDPKRKLANARSESVAVKSSFKEIYFKNRCIVPMQGYYEWYRPNDETKPKQPYFIYSKQMPLLPVAGIFQDEELTILTRTANQKLSKIHDRMPVLVAPKNWTAWLGGVYQDAAQIEQLIPQIPQDFLAAYPVGTNVNNSRSQGADLIGAIGKEI